MKRLCGFEVSEFQAFWGVFLIATGFLKLSFSESNPAPLLSNSVFWLIGIGEITVGCAFLLFRKANFAVFGLCLFTTFLIAAVFLSVMRAPSCRCLGSIPFSPTSMAEIDTFATTVTAMTKTTKEPHKRNVLPETNATLGLGRSVKTFLASGFRRLDRTLTAIVVRISFVGPNGLGHFS